MPKIIVEEEGQPSVTLLIDPAEPPVSLGALLERARKFREEAAAKNGQTDVGGYAFTPAPGQDTRPATYEVRGSGGAPVQRAINTAVLRSILSRIWQGKTTSDPDAVVTVHRNEWASLSHVLESALAPPFIAPKLSDAEMDDIRSAGPGNIIFAPDPESDLEDVLDSYRLAGKPCGLQVFAVDHVVCWIGDIEDTGLHDGRFQIRQKTVPYPPTFHQAYGANALEDAAKWLREQLDQRPPSAFGVAGGGGWGSGLKENGSARMGAPPSDEIRR